MSLHIENHLTEQEELRQHYIHFKTMLEEMMEDSVRTDITYLKSLKDKVEYYKNEYEHYQSM